MRNKDGLSCWLRKKCTMLGSCIEFYFGQNEDYSLGGSISDNSKKLPQRGRGKFIYTWLWWRGSKYNQAHIFCRKLLLVPGGLLLVRGVDITMKDLRAFLDMKWCKSSAHKISWKYPTIWWPILKVFPGHRVPHSWSSPWTSFRGYFEGLWSQQLWINPCRGRWQVPTFSWHS